MSDLQALYQEVILDHYKKPRNYKQILSEITHQGDGHNHLCGDQLHLNINMSKEKLLEISFEGTGCAISVASASLMTEKVKNLSKEEISTLFEAFHKMVTKGATTEEKKVLGKSSILEGVLQFPMRVKCASLAWHTLMTALEGNQKSISTE